MTQAAYEIPHQDQDIRLHIHEGFDGLRTSEELHEFCSRSATTDRIILDFSDISRIRALEIYSLLLGLASDRCFDSIYFSLEGVKGEKLF